jgi:hypothetical protein
MKGDEMGGHAARMELLRNAYTILIGDPEKGKITLRIDLEEIGWEVVV